VKQHEEFAEKIGGLSAFIHVYRRPKTIFQQVPGSLTELELLGDRETWD
jgi:hypothetical protein